MADRIEIREVVFNMIVDAVPSSVTVSREYPQNRSELPRVVYEDNHRPLAINRASAQPDKVVYDGNGYVEYEEYREYTEGIFTITIRASNDDDAETYYESVHREFGKYHSPQLFDPRDQHPDINHIEVQEVNTSVQNETNVLGRGDTVQVFIRYHRDYRRDEGEYIEEINQNIDPN